MQRRKDFHENFNRGGGGGGGGSAGHGGNGEVYRNVEAFPGVGGRGVDGEAGDIRLLKDVGKAARFVFASGSGTGRLRESPLLAMHRLCLPGGGGSAGQMGPAGHGGPGGGGGGASRYFDGQNTFYEHVSYQPLRQIGFGSHAGHGGFGGGGGGGLTWYFAEPVDGMISFSYAGGQGGFGGGAGGGNLMVTGVSPRTKALKEADKTGTASDDFEGYHRIYDYPRGGVGGGGGGGPVCIGGPGCALIYWKA
ncbi:MAG: hypothetical protein N0E59_02245 [Candidatus Thiodiazotropha taylori]|nr:hypothetical protein [Candidatus Thiodiazotropha taylori]MCG8051922.1 hypothetical protein [Candidatus Thiodiazotropha taylori]MCG8109560.1 hypothetical protein [Candidatus Thiodiazotropha taylori]MCW4281904.1 hypothetical protein [Candidatus Thiodiazotropha taylori]MCW4306090.1 hypothetical protein [Candidatus Thiodiazotropha taylori]